MSDVTPDYIASIDFLNQMHPARRWVLTAIHPDKKTIVTATFDLQRAKECEAWLAMHGADKNIYWSVGEVSRDVQKKAERTDISRVWWLHVDIDPRAGEDIAAEQQRALALLRKPPGLLPPTCIVFSGGGYQAFWALREPINTDCKLELAEDAKLYNLHIEIALGADQCHDVSRIMRLPGTINRPDQKKAAKGRVPALAHVVEPSHWDDPQYVYSIEQFTKAPSVAIIAPAVQGAINAKPTIDPKYRRINSVDDLPPGVEGKIREIILAGIDPDNPHLHGNPPDRSKWLLRVCCGLVRGGCDDDTIYSVIVDPQYPISESVIEKGRSRHAYAIRQILRARENVQNEPKPDALRIKNAANGFQTKDDGKVLINRHNIRVALDRLGVRIAHDEFAEVDVVEGLAEFGPRLNDKAMTRLRLDVSERFQMSVPKEHFYDLITDIAIENRFNPVCDYLAALQWDGIPRMETWLINFAGADDTPLNRAVSRLLLLAAVRRARQPGCKFDEMVILESEQGLNKSSAIKLLAVRNSWFADDLPLDADTQRQMEAMEGAWIIEAGELKGMRRGEIGALKSFLARTEDRARMAYGRLPVEKPRRCVFIGTTNDAKYFRDATGNRRFWPVAVRKFDLESLARDRDQLWAEAAHYEAEGESIRLDPALYEAAAAVQEERFTHNPFWEVLDPLLGEAQVVGKLPSKEIWKVLGKTEVGRRTQQDHEWIGECMAKLGWKAEQRRFGSGKRLSCYTRGTAAERQGIALQADCEMYSGDWQIISTRENAAEEQGSK